MVCEAKVLAQFVFHSFWRNWLICIFEAENWHMTFISFPLIHFSCHNLLYEVCVCVSLWAYFLFWLFYVCVCVMKTLKTNRRRWTRNNKTKKNCWSDHSRKIGPDIVYIEKKQHTTNTRCDICVYVQIDVISVERCAHSTVRPSIRPPARPRSSVENKRDFLALSWWLVY